MNEIKGVEVFSAGVWNGDEYTEQHLDYMVQAFEENQEHIKPYLKLGHDENQKILQADGLPAAGWIGKLYRQGDKLVADFIDIPDKIYQLLKNKAYKKVSCEIYWNLKIKEKVYDKMLAAVALLGSDMPAVMNLDDILSMYGFKDYETLKSYASTQTTNTLIKTYAFKEDDSMSKTETEIKLEQDAEIAKAKLLELEAELKSYKQKDEEIAILKKTALETEEELKSYKQKTIDAENETWIGKLYSEKLAVKSMKEDLLKLSEKKTEIEEILKKFKAASEVNFKESSTDVTAPTEIVNDFEKTEAEIQKHMVDHKVSYKAAYVEVMKKTKK